MAASAAVDSKLTCPVLVAHDLSGLEGNLSTGRWNRGAFRCGALASRLPTGMHRTRLDPILF